MAPASNGDRRIRPLLMAAGLAVLLTMPAALASTESKPAPPPDATRVHTFGPNLDGKAGRERIFVYKRLRSGFAKSFFSVWQKLGPDRWSDVQTRRIVTSPGASSSGLVDAWAGDLNHEGRVEIAARDFITPSVGEVLSIFRQKHRHALRFKPLQSVPGDRVTLKTRHHKAAVVKDLIKSNHSTDGLTHHEVFRWSDGKGRWVCRVDCMPPPHSHAIGGPQSKARTVTVNRRGKIGPLRVNRSTKRDVREFAGKPRFKGQIGTGG